MAGGRAVNACTIIARNYLAHARVLAESFCEHHPDGTFTVLVIDDTGAEQRSAEPFAILSPYEIGIDRAEVHRMAFIYDIKEFATALKPWLLEQLLSTSDHAVYFDPDIEVFAPLDDITELARSHGVVLTPHTTRPLPRDQLLPSEEMVLRAGIYNLGFIGVGRGARPFLAWWQERLARDCLVDVDNGVFVDQKWIDFVPALFEHVIVGDPTCNVAYWNLSHRRLTWTGDRYEVDGVPLRFFHYSGFSPDTMELSAHMGDIPRIVLTDHPDVVRLCESYTRRLARHGYARGVDGAYRFDELPNGLAIDTAVRRDVREALLAAARAGEDPSPDPFERASVEDFVDWLADPVGSAGLPRHLDALYRRRRDLAYAFPEVAKGDTRKYFRWAYTTRRERAGVAKAALTKAIASGRFETPPESRAAAVEGALRRLAHRHRSLSPLAAAYGAAHRGLRRSRPANDRPVVSIPSFPPLPGVNVVGYLRAELGVGEAARRLIAGLEAGAIPHSTITYGRTVSRQEHPFRGETRVPAYDTNVVCVNADEIANVRSDLPELVARRYTIGLWFWEVSRFPRELHGAFQLVDEVWVASEYVRDAVAAATTKPVRVVPLPVEAPPRPLLTRADLDLPEGFVFLFSFDFLSVPERKNPFGLIDAFTTAFAPREGLTLVVKTINGDRKPEVLERLQRRAAKRPDVRIVDGYVSSAERDGLMALCDCYVSLHRSEGYGLTIAEAMAAAKPVIATGFSGNMTFMDERNSLLVPYRVTTIPAGCDPYPVGAEWAEPDLDSAANLMRQVYENQDWARRLGRRAREDILVSHGPLRTAEFVATRLDELRAQRSAKAVDPERAPLPGASLLTSGRRRPTRFVRRLLHRLLWPYLVEQHAFETAVAEALRAHESSLVTRTDGDMRMDAATGQEVTELQRTEHSELEPARPRQAGPRDALSATAAAAPLALADEERRLRGRGTTSPG
jgi:glycosyltransferase involved in cell wall biosynthesis